MTNTSHTFEMTFSLSFRWSVGDERSFAYAQDDKGKEFGMTFFVFAILMIFFVFIIPGIFLLFLSFRGTIVTRNLILTSNKFFILILLVNRIKV